MSTLRGAPPQHTWDLARLWTRHRAVTAANRRVMLFWGVFSKSQKIHPNIWQNCSIKIRRSMPPMRESSRIPSKKSQQSIRKCGKIVPFWTPNPSKMFHFPELGPQGRKRKKKTWFCSCIPHSRGALSGAILATFGALAGTWGHLGSILGAAKALQKTKRPKHRKTMPKRGHQWPKRHHFGDSLAAQKATECEKSFFA